MVSPLPNVRHHTRQICAPVSPIREEDEEIPRTPEPEDHHSDDQDKGHDAYDDGLGDEEPQMEEDAPQSLADTIALLARTLQQPCDTLTTPSKVCKPDQFNSSNPRKLHAFLMQWEFNFNDRPNVWQDHTKVNYALSYLKGTALN